MREYTTKTGKIQTLPTLGEDVTEANFEDGTGWCLACGDTQSNCEPDARCYTCEQCGAEKVYGLAELALMGWID